MSGRIGLEFSDTTIMKNLCLIHTGSQGHGREEVIRRECPVSGICPLGARTVSSNFFPPPNRKETRKGQEN